MQTPQHRCTVGDVAEGQGDMFLAGSLIEETVHGEHTEGRGQLGGGDEHDGHRNNSNQAERQGLYHQLQACRA